MPRIRTTVVGSYPIPAWLVASPSEQALLDATRVVIHTQEQAGVDVVCDGELYRFDINHPETNGMIEYFVRPMDGITQRFSFDDLIAYRSSTGMKFRTRPPGTVVGPIGHGALDLPLGMDLSFDGTGLNITVNAPDAGDVTIAILSNPLGVNESDVENQILPGLIGPLVPSLAGALSGFPLPQFFGLAIDGVEVSRSGQFISIYADLN